ncbi:MAG TPA: hypothetical protein VNK95_13055, partial [Caldilineaceae bacterium]|nr:hypothetical protein [Caldilineaceae bacterium]
MSDEQSISQVQPVRTAHGDQHHGVQGMVQRTARALSPWTRRWYQAGNRPQPLMPRLAGRVSAPLVMRVQRVAAPGGEQPALTDRFSALIVQRHAAANDLSRRYQVGLRRPLGPSPSQLPLPGVPATRSPEPVLQRQAMSLEELAESFGAGSLGGPLPSPMSRPALEGNPEQGVEPATPPRLADLQEQARRAAQRRPSPPATAAGEPAQLQRAPAQPGDPNFSIAAAIEERIRQARARRSGSHPAAPPPGEPSATAGAPIQR